MGCLPAGRWLVLVDIGRGREARRGEAPPRAPPSLVGRAIYPGRQRPPTDGVSTWATRTSISLQDSDKTTKLKRGSPCSYDGSDFERRIKTLHRKSRRGPARVAEVAAVPLRHTVLTACTAPTPLIDMEGTENEPRSSWWSVPLKMG